MNHHQPSSDALVANSDSNFLYAFWIQNWSSERNIDGGSGFQNERGAGEVKTGGTAYLIFCLLLGVLIRFIIYG